MKKTEQISIPWNVELVSSTESRPQVLLLHGFMQTADRVSSLISPVLDELEIEHVAIQAPFPVYKQLPDRYRVGYSWYFYDDLSKKHVIEKGVAVDFLTTSLSYIGALESITKVIGFSQGAYLAPHLAKSLPNTESVIGIGGRFFAEDFSTPPPFKLMQIHGADDQVVDAELSQAQHDLLVNSGVNSSFYLLEGVGHEINDPVRSQLRELLQS